MRRQFILTEEEFDGLRQIFKTFESTAIRGELFRRFWSAVGEKYGFDWETVEPVNGNKQAFTAEPKDIKVLETEK